MRDTYFTIAQIREDNAELGFHFFDAGTLRFFRSKVYPEVYGGHLFVTSEQQSSEHARLYTLRECIEGKVNTVGFFQLYPTLGQARTAAKREVKARAELARAVAQ